MNNYSELDKILHRQFLGSNSLSDYLYKRLINKSKSCGLAYLNQYQYIFVTGLARSGTTALLNKIFSSGEFASLFYSHMPFVLSPRIASFFSKNVINNNMDKIERYHKDGIFIDINSPECLDEVFWLKSNKENNKKEQKIIFEKISRQTLKGYAYFLSQFAKHQSKKRIIIKNNNNHIRMLSISNYLESSIFLVLFRDPISHSLSLLNQHKNFIKLQKENMFIKEYMYLIGHREFGINNIPFVYSRSSNDWYKNLDNMKITYWIKQWVETYSWILEKNFQNSKNIKLVCYERLCSENKYYESICKILNIKNVGTEFKLGNFSKGFEMETIPTSILKKAKFIYRQLLDISL